MSTKQKRIIIITFIVCAGIFVLASVAVYVYNQKSMDQAESTPVAATATPVVTPEPTADPHAGKVQSSINGTWVSEKTENTRPFAIMINNIEYAFKHQMGTSKADIIYEALAEGGITRMLAIYQER